MARPTKCRRVCYLPQFVEFSPCMGAGGEAVALTVDEFEAVRLIDREGLSQEECGDQLCIGRTSVQRIYESARKKIADALVLGLTLKIEGGDFELCSGNSAFCYKSDCAKRQIENEFNTEKGENTMRIAVTYENGEIFQHFGHTEQFKVYDIDGGRIIDSRVVDTNGQGHGALAGVLASINADVLICGGIGGGAQIALADAGIKLYGGCSGNADEAVKAYLADSLEYNPNVKCNHHDHEHGEGHTCGSHGCGKGSCGSH